MSTTERSWESFGAGPLDVEKLAEMANRFFSAVPGSAPEPLAPQPTPDAFGSADTRLPYAPPLPPLVGDVTRFPDLAVVGAAGIRVPGLEHLFAPPVVPPAAAGGLDIPLIRRDFPILSETRERATAGLARQRRDHAEAAGRDRTAEVLLRARELEHPSRRARTGRARHRRL